MSWVDPEAVMHHVEADWRERVYKYRNVMNWTTADAMRRVKACMRWWRRTLEGEYLIMAYQALVWAEVRVYLHPTQRNGVWRERDYLKDLQKELTKAMLG